MTGPDLRRRAPTRRSIAEDERARSTSNNYTVFRQAPEGADAGRVDEARRSAEPRGRLGGGRDRAAVMMGGHKTEIWWWNGKAFVSYGRAESQRWSPG